MCAKRGGSSGYSRTTRAGLTGTMNNGASAASAPTAKDIDALSARQVRNVAKAAFIRAEMERAATYETPMTGKKVTESEAARRFEAMASGKSITTLRNYAKKNKRYLTQEDMPKKRSASKGVSSSRTKKASNEKTSISAVRRSKAPKQGTTKTFNVGSERIRVSRGNKAYNISRNNGSFTVRTWNQVKDFVVEIIRSI